MHPFSQVRLAFIIYNMILTVVLHVVGLIFLRRLAKKAEEIKEATMKLRLCVYRLTNEAPSAAEAQANSIMGLEADVCAIRATLKAMKDDMWRIKEAMDA